MQLDKDTLIKHRFWILLCLVVPMILVVLIVLPASVGSSTEAKTKEVEQAKSNLILNQPKNPEWMKGLEKKEAVVTEQQKAVWGEAWKAQAGLFTWPSELSDRLGNHYFGQDIYRELCADYAAKRYDLAQAREILKIVQPVLPGSPRPVVLLRNPNPLRTLVKFARVQPSPEEIWLAQEDLWVQRELLQVVRDANDSVAQFRVLPNFAASGVTGAGLYHALPVAAYWPAASPKTELRQKFYNPNWELDLTLATNAKKEPVLRGTIKNVSRRKLSLGMHFDVQFTPTRQEGDAGVGHLQVDDEPVAAGKTIAFKESSSLAQAVGRSPGLYGVEQVFTWKTAPVKRLDALALFRTSHRNANSVLKPARQFAPSGEVKPAEGSAPPGGENETQLAPPVGVPGGAGSPTGSRLTESGFVRDRYIHVTEQVRRMPVALTVTVEQNHIPNVIAAFSNSRLRMQVTQVHLVHVRGDTLRAPAEGSGGSGGTDDGGLPQKGGFRGFPGGDRGERGSEDGGGGVSIGGGRPIGIGGGGVGQPGAGSGMVTSAPTEQDEGNLVELTVYALASLYDKYPPKPSTPTGDPGKPGDAPKP